MGFSGAEKHQPDLSSSGISFIGPVFLRVQVKF